MALPIKPTPSLKGKAAKEFLKRMEEVDNNPEKIEVKAPDISKASEKIKNKHPC